MAKVVAIRYFSINKVYNMEVFGLHNYVTPKGTVLHNCRYYCVSRKLAAEAAMEKEEQEEETEDYETTMCGGDMTEGYMAG